MKTDLEFRNKYDQMHFYDIIKKKGFVHLEVTGRGLGEYKHVIFTGYEGYTGSVYSTDIYKKIILGNILELGLYSGRYLKVERVVGSVSIDKFGIDNWYIKQELNYNGKKETIEFLQNQEIYGAG